MINELEKKKKNNQEEVDNLKTIKELLEKNKNDQDQLKKENERLE